MQGSARKDVVCGAARVYIVVLPGPKWKSWFRRSEEEVNLRWVVAPAGSLVLEADLGGWRQRVVVDVEGNQIYYAEESR